MDNTLLLISSGSTFMVDALSNGLKDVGINVIKTQPKINELEKYKNTPSVFLFYLGSYIEDISDVLVYLKDMVIEQDKILCTIGDASEYNTLIKSIPADYIREHYERPLNVKNVAEEEKGFFLLMTIRHF